MTKTLAHYIGGEFTGASDALESVNPSDTNDVVARFPDGGDKDVAAAVAAAKAAQPGWANASPEVRSDLLDKVANLIFARSAEIGELLAREEARPAPKASAKPCAPRGSSAISGPRRCAAMASRSKAPARAWTSRPIARQSAWSG
jgi:acyl-CoA reductase-like NAD-dependent aldehyde dehydrogenase